jgi:hypothetical protein
VDEFQFPHCRPDARKAKRPESFRAWRWQHYTQKENLTMTTKRSQMAKDRGSSRHLGEFGFRGLGQNRKANYLERDVLQTWRQAIESAEWE